MLVDLYGESGWRILVIYDAADDRRRLYLQFSLDDGVSIGRLRE